MEKHDWPEDISEIKDTLLEERKNLIKHIQEHHVVERDRDVADEIDLSVSAQESDLQMILHERELDKLKVIEDALERMETGEYGWCEETGEWIGKKRLQAMPFTRLSVEAQQERERGNRGRRTYDDDSSYWK